MLPTEIFAAAPAALQLFPFKDELDLYKSSALKRHALGVMTTVGKAVNMLDDLEALVPVLKELGAKHVNYGVEEAHCES
jgi:hemoglobin-like flavoprotein